MFYVFVCVSAVELLPVEQRRLLKWKMSTVTPNVVKRVIARSHFKATKSKSVCVRGTDGDPLIQYTTQFVSRL